MFTTFFCLPFPILYFRPQALACTPDRPSVHPSKQQSQADAFPHFKCFNIFLFVIGKFLLASVEGKFTSIWKVIYHLVKLISNTAWR